MNKSVTIAIANDHGGLPLKSELLGYLSNNGYSVLDFGTNTPNSVDYPDYSDMVTSAVLRGEATAGILICGSGIGMSISANRRKGIRAALCHDTYTARITRTHNDANVLVMGARVIGSGVAVEITDAFLSTSFSHDERHLHRLGKIEKDHIEKD